MRLRGIRRRRGAERGFVISDHADWDALLRAVAETGAEKIFPTHGYTEIFARHLKAHGDEFVAAGEKQSLLQAPSSVSSKSNHQLLSLPFPLLLRVY